MRGSMISAAYRFRRCYDIQTRTNNELLRHRRRAVMPNRRVLLDAAVRSAGIVELCNAVLSVDRVRLYEPRPEAYALVTSHFGIAAATCRVRLVEPVVYHGRSNARLSASLDQPLREPGRGQGSTAAAGPARSFCSIVADDLRRALRADGNRLRLHRRQQLRRYEPALLQRRNLLVDFVDREARVRTDVEIESHQDHHRT